MNYFRPDVDEGQCGIRLTGWVLTLWDAVNGKFHRFFVNVGVQPERIVGSVHVVSHQGHSHWAGTNWHKIQEFVHESSSEGPVWCWTWYTNGEYQVEAPTACVGAKQNLETQILFSQLNRISKRKKRPKDKQRVSQISKFKSRN